MSAGASDTSAGSSDAIEDAIDGIADTTSGCSEASDGISEVRAGISEMSDGTADVTAGGNSEYRLPSCEASVGSRLSCAAAMEARHASSTGSNFMMVGVMELCTLGFPGTTWIV